jgi:hypothetical protein
MGVVAKNLVRQWLIVTMEATPQPPYGDIGRFYGIQKYLTKSLLSLQIHSVSRFISVK